MSENDEVLRMRWSECVYSCQTNHSAAQPISDVTSRSVISVVRGSQMSPSLKKKIMHFIMQFQP